MKIVLIGLAGGLGAIARYGIQNGAQSLLGGPTVWGTFLINISGALVLGLIVGFTEERGNVDAPLRTILAVGFLGAYTTFSTLMLETVSRAEADDLPLAITYIAASVVLGLVAAGAGLALGRAIG